MRYQHQTGFSLIELMISVTLGLILAAGVVNIYLDSRHSFVQDEEISRTQENARFALRLLAKELSMSGFFGGVLQTGSVSDGGIVIQNDCGTGWTLDISNPTEFLNNAKGADANGAFACIPAANVYQDPVSGSSDVLAIRRVAGDYTLENGRWNGPKGVTASSFAASENQVYLRIINRKNITEFVKAQDANTAADAVAGSSVDYWRYIARVFYVRNHSQTTADGIPTLCAANLRQNKMWSDANECYAEGVENFQLEFGVDSNDDGVVDYFEPAPDTTELRTSVAVRIYLLMRSVNPIAGGQEQGNRSYQLGSAATVGPYNDNFYRRVFSTTVLLKNRFVF